MRALLHLMLMATASHALRDMQSAAELKAEKDVEGSEQPAGKCKAKPEHQSHKGICAMSQEKFLCDSQYLFCDWVPAKKIPPHCEVKPEHPSHKGICDMNRNNQMICESQYLFCDWVPEKVVYEF
eukprot:Skav214628  [mRNA]  locus=scaffold1009:30704:31078:- [translate_table: standard]